jgi:hypothetical protein
VPYHGIHHELFDWDDANVEHVRHHGVEPPKAEEGLGDPRRIRADAYRQGGELRQAFLGATTRGRVLMVVVTRRAGRIRVVTAHDATDRQRRRYRRRRR